MREMSPTLAPDEIRRPARVPKSSVRSAVPTPGVSRARPRGPGPSKLAFRLRRAWASPAVRSALLVYLPLSLLALAGWRIAASDVWRERIGATVAATWERLAARPEFAVRGIEVEGAKPALAALIRETIGLTPGMSSLKLDLEALRTRIERLGPVESASVRFDPAGTLVVSVIERVPAALFRRGDGQLVVVDRAGVEIGPAASREAHPRLPVVLGEGAARHIPEVEAILESAPEIVPRLRALVRIGERRWDLVLEGGLLVMLPETGFLDALEWLRRRDREERLLARDIAVVDLRLVERPTVRSTPRALEALRIERALQASGGRDT